MKTKEPKVNWTGCGFKVGGVFFVEEKLIANVNNRTPAVRHTKWCITQCHPLMCDILF